MAISKEKICHDLSVAFAVSETAKKQDEPAIMAEFDDNERLLIFYENCYKYLERYYGDILERHKEIVEERKINPTLNPSTAP